jgi:hypothetical protein
MFLKHPVPQVTPQKIVTKFRFGTVRGWISSSVALYLFAKLCHIIPLLDIG